MAQAFPGQDLARASSLVLPRGHVSESRARRQPIYSTIRYTGAQLLRYRSHFVRHPTICLNWLGFAVTYLKSVAMRDRAIARFVGTKTSVVSHIMKDLAASPFQEELRIAAQTNDWRVSPALYSPLWGPTLFALVRATRPRIVLETGVAHGVSTAHILSALDKNKSGQLYSLDKSIVWKQPRHPNGEQVPAKLRGALVPASLRMTAGWRWNLRDGLITCNSLKKILTDLKWIDLFVHDSDHSEEHMYMELTTAWEHMRPGGILVVDDILTNPEGLRHFLTATKLSRIRCERLGPMALIRRLS